MRLVVIFEIDTEASREAMIEALTAPWRSDPFHGAIIGAGGGRYAVTALEVDGQRFEVPPCR